LIEKHQENFGENHRPLREWIPKGLQHIRTLLLKRLSFHVSLKLSCGFWVLQGET